MIRLTSPISELFFVTANFLQRYIYGTHYGLDLRTAVPSHPSGYGTPILAAATGDYVESGYKKSYGYYILLEHKHRRKKYRTLYAHLSKINHQPGWSIRYQGDVIGFSGNSGYFTTGAHLHFELQQWVNKNWVQVDPMKGFIKFYKDKKK